MAEIIKFQYIDGKNKWVVKQDSNTQKWISYKNNKRIKSSQHWINVVKEIPGYENYGQEK